MKRSNTRYSFRWLADRVAAYGWVLRHKDGRHLFYVGKGLPQTLIEVEERRIGGRPVMVVTKEMVDVFDESIREKFGETLYDGSEEEIEGEFDE
jgi:hypothetical protein